MHHCKIVIADDHPLFRAALKQAVSKVAKQVDIVEVSSMAFCIHPFPNYAQRQLKKMKIALFGQKLDFLTLKIKIK